MNQTDLEFHKKFVTTITDIVNTVSERNEAFLTDYKEIYDRYIANAKDVITLFNFFSENADEWMKRSAASEITKKHFYRNIQDKCNFIWYDTTNKFDSKEEENLIKELRASLAKANSILQKYNPTHIPSIYKRTAGYVNYYPDGYEEETFSYPDPLYECYQHKTQTQTPAPVPKEKITTKREPLPRRAKQGIKYT